MNFRYDINGLRAIAVIAVVLFHFNPAWVPGGFAGVDVFFVISGFLMTGIIFRGLENDSFNLFKFYVARAHRIIPALLAVCVAVLVLGWLFLPPFEYKPLGKHIASSVVFLSNFVYWKEAGYFGVASHSKWLLHTWSLSVEWQFYIIYPLVLLGLKRFLSLENLKRLIVLGTVLGFAFSVVATMKWSNPAYYLLPTRAWEMMMGGVAFLYPWNLTDQKKKLVEIAGLVLILGAYAFVSSDNLWPGYLAIIPVLGAYLMIVANQQSSVITNNLAFQNIGKWSYSIYLWHWPVMVFGYVFELDAWIYPGIVISFFLGMLSFKFIEQFKFPIENVNFKNTLQVSVFSCVLFSGVLVFKNHGFEYRYSSLVEDVVNLERLGKISKAWEFTGYPEPNNLFTDPVSKLKAIGSNSKSKTLLVGDSHSYQYMNSFDFLEGSSSYNSVVFQQPSFPPRIEDFPNDPAISVVAISYFWGYKYGSPNVKQELRCCGNGKNRTVGRISIPYKTKEEMDLIDSKLERYISELQSMGKKVIVVLDNPFGEELNAQSMLYRTGFKISLKPNMVLTKKDAEERSHDTRDRLLSIAKKFDIEVIDPIAHLCSSGVCNAFSPNNDLIYKDYDHISLYASRNSVSYIRDIVK